MRQGTAPKYEFTLPNGTDQLLSAKVVFKQGPYVIVEKKLGDLKIEPNKITAQLTQEDTFLFCCDAHMKVQLRGLTFTGEPLNSDEFTDFVEECLDNEVLT